MKPSLIVCFIVCSLIFSSCFRQNYKKINQGVLISLDSTAPNQTRLIRLEVVDDHIIHARITAGNKFTEEKSLIAVNQTVSPVSFKCKSRCDTLFLCTSELIVKVALKTGVIQYCDKEGKVKLCEREERSKIFTPDSLDGKSCYSIQQVFESPDDEAFYGLGQHQHNLMNYKGRDVDLYQHNLIVVVPFLVSSRNYGILWDNYSRSKFGDPREYQELTSLKLYNESEEAGGLTVKYFLSENSSKAGIIRTENKINYEFLDDLQNMPSGFSMEKGKVVWEGFIESANTGLHKFLYYASSYTRFWFNNELVDSSWRQGWLPWSKQFVFNMEKGKKYPIKVEWIPGSKESFLSLKYLTPAIPEEQKQLSFYSEIADQIDYYYVSADNLDGVISGYRKITGRSSILPKWAMGMNQSRERYKTQDEIISVVSEFRKRHIPIDNIILDWMYWPENRWGDHIFDSTRFPDPVGMVEQLHNKLNTRIMISVWPKFYEGADNFNYMKEKGWLYMYNVNNRQKDWVGPGYVSTFYDAYNPEARKYYWDQIKTKLYDKGFDAWWMDATEPDIKSNVSCEERKKLNGPTFIGPAAKYFNTYSLLQSMAVYDGQRSADPDKRVFILTRSAFAGQQRYAAVTWSGDLASNWYNMKIQIPAALNFSLSGIPNWTMDIGGFSVERRYEHAQGKDLDEWRELNTRWFQFGTFCSLLRVHGQYPYREMFNIAPENHPAYQSMLYYAKLRYRLIPYIYTLEGMTWHNDYTIMRALIMDFPEDAHVYSLADQYMFGPSLMICPIYEYNARSREVYLPKGTGWYDLYSGNYYNGGQTIQAAAPLDRIPVFVKEGAIIPFGSEIEYTSQDTTGDLMIFVYEGRSNEFTLYEDEGVNYNYEKGSFTQIPITYDAKNSCLIIGEMKGSFEGCFKERNIQVYFVKKDHPVSLQFDRKTTQMVKYSGKTVKIPVK